ncbi:MAG: hypothetical protein M3O46_02630 [Myxococcota bacterium]|nr:hypothetical protein [Myxococcota bacterium]
MFASIEPSAELPAFNGEVSLISVADDSRAYTEDLLAEPHSKARNKGVHKRQAALGPGLNAGEAVREEN